MNKKLSFGIIGTGRIAQWFCDDIKHSTYAQDIEIIGGWDINPLNSEQYKTKNSLKKTYATYQQLFDDKKINAVYIGASDLYHYEYAKMALENNKHVFVEKPICYQLSQLETLKKIADERKLILFDGIKTGFSPAYQQLKKEIANGTIGEIQYVQASHIKVSTSGKIPNPLPDAKIAGFHMAGGMYALFIALDLCGPGKSITYMNNTYLQNKSGIATSVLNIRHQNSAISTVAGSDCLTNNLCTTIMGNQGYALLGGDLEKYNENYRKDSCHMAHTLKIFDLKNQLLKNIDIPFETDGEGLCFEINAFYEMFNKGVTNNAILPYLLSYQILEAMVLTNNVNDEGVVHLA